MRWIYVCKKVAPTYISPHGRTGCLRHTFVFRSAIPPIFGPKCPKFDVVWRGAVLLSLVVRIQIFVDYATMNIFA